MSEQWAGLHAYHVATRMKDYPFYALIMAAGIKADTDNMLRLREAFPEIMDEFQRRWNARLGVLPEDKVEDMDFLAEQIGRMTK